jgi:hypothetical protein
MIGSEKAQTWIRQLWKAYVTLWRQMKKIKFIAYDFRVNWMGAVA